MDTEKDDLRYTSMETEPRSDRYTTSSHETDASSTQIKSEIDKTRSEMDQTLDQLGQKLHPRNLLDELIGLFRNTSGTMLNSAGHEISQTAQSVGTALLQQVKKNPGPALLMGAGLVWMLFEESTENRPYKRRLTDRRRRYADVEPSHRSLVDARTGLPYEESYDDDSYGIEPERRERGYRISEESTYFSTAGTPPYSSGETAPTSSGSLSQAGEKIQDTLSGAGEAIRSTASRASEATGEIAHTVKEKAGEMAHAAGRSIKSTGRRVSGMTQSARESLDQYGHTVGDYSTSMAYQTRVWGDRLMQQTQRSMYYARHRFRDAMATSPLGVGTVFLGLGMVAGLLAPRTRQEDRLIGETADSLKDRARETGEEMIEHGLAVAGHAVKAITAEAKAQGLTPDEVSSRLGRVVSRIQSSVTDATREEGLDVQSLKEKAGNVVQKATETVKRETREEESQVNLTDINT